MCRTTAGSSAAYTSAWLGSLEISALQNSSAVWYLIAGSIKCSAQREGGVTFIVRERKHFIAWNKWDQINVRLLVVVMLLCVYGIMTWMYLYFCSYYRDNSGQCLWERVCGYGKVRRIGTSEARSARDLKVVPNTWPSSRKWAIYWAVKQTLTQDFTH